MPDVQYDAVVIGSGFGGTVAALTLANLFATRNKGERVCLVERGQWWISHELTYTKPGERTLPPNMREFLEDSGEPHNFWAHPDNVEGLLDLASKARLLNRAGLYDYRQISDNVSVLAASGVGGGSLVYSNVTLEPHPSVYKNWPTEFEGASLNEYFDPARIFIGVNKITTVAGLGKKNTKLEKAKIFQEAAEQVRVGKNTILNHPSNDLDATYALDLSITDVPDGAFNDFTKDTMKNATPADFMESLKQTTQTNVCQRQGRCNLGCLPGARHTLNKKIVTALQDVATKGILRVQALCEADLIEFIQPDTYRIHCTRYTTEPNTPAVKEQMLTKLLVVSAGTLGTNELLLRSEERGLKFSKRLGEGFSTDGDLFGFMTLEHRRIDITRGPINTSHAFFKSADTGEFGFSIEDTTISKMVAPLFATLLELAVSEWKFRRKSTWDRIKLGLKLALKWRQIALLGLIVGVTVPRALKVFRQFWNNNAIQSMLSDLLNKRPIQDNNTKNLVEEIIDYFTKDYETPYASPEERLSKYFIFSCMGLDKANGQLSLDPNNRLQLAWSARENKKIFDEITDGMRQLAEEIEPGGSKRVYTPTWNQPPPNKDSLIVLHPLGGCEMGKDAGEGVVNSYGQVFMDDQNDRAKVYPGFYVMDGSIVPSALGVNSSLTITALAFRCAEHLAAALGGDKTSWPNWKLIQAMLQLKQ